MTKRNPFPWIMPVLLTGLAACTSTSINPNSAPQSSVTPAAPPPAQVDVASLPGNYGLASYHREEDKERTLKQAEIACRNPFKIQPGSNGGIVMHAPAQSGPAEFYLKKDAQGQSYIGPRGKVGVANDQRVVSYENGTLITEWTGERLRAVYGTMVYVPCAQA